MKRQKRGKVFETNSSSTHSITIESGGLTAGELRIAEDNKVHVTFGEFGWEVCDYSDQYEKLQYILTMCACTEGRNCTSPDEFYETEGYKLISSAVSEYCHCDGIEVESDINIECYDNKIYLDFDGYIDHQSCDYSSVAEFLKENYISSVEEFIFDNGIIVHTDNDNH